MTSLKHHFPKHFLSDFFPEILKKDIKLLLYKVQKFSRLSPSLPPFFSHRKTLRGRGQNPPPPSGARATNTAKETARNECIFSKCVLTRAELDLEPTSAGCWGGGRISPPPHTLSYGTTRLSAKCESAIESSQRGDFKAILKFS